MPKKIQFAPSQAKWSLQSSQSVLLLVDLADIKNQLGAAQSELLENLNTLMQKAKALDIPIIDLYGDDAMHCMQRLGEVLSNRSQIIIAGKITTFIKQILPHIHSVTEQICLVEDAILLHNATQHIQWLDSQTAQALHHMNSYSVKRLWNLTAPATQILSEKGIVLAIAEQLQMDALEIDPTQDLHDYGLDSLAIVNLVGLWRANGASIRYEDFVQHRNLSAILALLLQSAQN